jgi:hypothetical protein
MALLCTLLLLASASASTSKHTASTPGSTNKSKSATHKASTHKASTHKVSTHSKGKPASGKSKKTRQKKGSWKRRGQHEIDAQRAREIQEALIREKYLDGAPTGIWDARSKAAMQRYQAEHGMQSKSIPDSRALIQLGLGPKHENTLNPETAATTQVISMPATPQR